VSPQFVSQDVEQRVKPPPQRFAVNVQGLGQIA